MAFPIFQSLSVAEFRQQVLSVVRVVFEKKPAGEELLPVLIVLSDSGEATIVPTNTFMTDDESKDQFVQTLQAMARDPTVVAFATVNEVWVSNVKGKTATTRPSEDPERTEGVMVKIDSRVAGVDLLLAKIENSELGTFEEMPPAGGRMAGSVFGTDLPN
jgi:hypothetical protein